MIEIVVLVFVFLLGGFVGFVSAAAFAIGSRDENEPMEWREILHQQQQQAAGFYQPPAQTRITKNDINWEI